MRVTMNEDSFPAKYKIDQSCPAGNQDEQLVYLYWQQNFGGFGFE
ncbi:hypothetical protein NSU18_09685 [Paenibacillus sp. FSL H8-0048]